MCVLSCIFLRERQREGTFEPLGLSSADVQVIKRVGIWSKAPRVRKQRANAHCVKALRSPNAPVFHPAKYLLNTPAVLHSFKSAYSEGIAVDVGSRLLVSELLSDSPR